MIGRKLTSAMRGFDEAGRGSENSHWLDLDGASPATEKGGGSK